MSRRLAIATTLALALAAPPATAERSSLHNPVLEWNAIMLSTLAGQNPFAQARFAAITQLAVFDAVNACTGRFQPYLSTVAAPEGASPRRGGGGCGARRAEALLRRP